jgi:hypothetical protein
MNKNLRHLLLTLVGAMLGKLAADYVQKELRGPEGALLGAIVGFAVSQLFD